MARRRWLQYERSQRAPNRCQPSAAPQGREEPAQRASTLLSSREENGRPRHRTVLPGSRLWTTWSSLNASGFENLLRGFGSNAVAELTMEKIEAIEAVTPPGLRRGRFTIPDKLIASLRGPQLLWKAIEADDGFWSGFDRINLP